MSLFRNKHLLVAALMAPIMALVGYFAIDIFLGETPQAAKPGQTYKLAEKPGCRYAGGKCGLKNVDFELGIRIEPIDGNRSMLLLDSAFPLEGVMAALVDPLTQSQSDADPVPMEAQGAEGLSWSLAIDSPVPGRHRLQVATASQGTFYYGDAATEFLAEENPDAE